MPDYSYKLLPLTEAKSYQEACYQIPHQKNQSSPLHQVLKQSCLPGHGLCKGWKTPLQTVTERSMQRNCLPDHPFPWFRFKRELQTTCLNKHISAETHDASPTAFFLSPTHKGQQATSVCMAANYIGHLPSRTDLDNTKGYILSEINCS